MYRRDFDRRGPPPGDFRGPPPPGFDRGPPRRDFERRPFDERRLGGGAPGPMGDFERGPRGMPPAMPDLGQPAIKSAVMAPPKVTVDREKTCPLLLRVFPKLGSHRQLEEYARRGDEPKDEVQIYTWVDATLRELCDLVKEVQPAARRPQARLSFALVYPDRRGRNVMRQVGQVHSSRLGEDDAKNLRGMNFQTGDFLDVAIY